MFYAGATNYVLQTCRGQLEGEILSATWGTPLRYSVALFTDCPTLSFSLLAVRRLQTGNEATTNLKLQTVNDERQLATCTSQAPPPASLQSLREWLLACSTSACQASPAMPCILLVINIIARLSTHVQCMCVASLTTHVYTWCPICDHLLCILHVLSDDVVQTCTCITIPHVQSSITYMYSVFYMYMCLVMMSYMYKHVHHHPPWPINGARTQRSK